MSTERKIALQREFETENDFLLILSLKLSVIDKIDQDDEVYWIDESS